eukprot:c17499_g1_i2 orf=1028-1285(+)
MGEPLDQIGPLSSHLFYNCYCYMIWCKSLDHANSKCRTTVAEILIVLQELCCIVENTKDLSLVIYHLFLIPSFKRSFLVLDKNYI